MPPGKLDQEQLRTKAKELAKRFRVVLEQVDDGYIGTISEVSAVRVFAETVQRCEREARGSLERIFFAALKDGLDPLAADDSTRVMINARVSPSERESLKQLAESLGFPGVTGLLRALANKQLQVRR